MYLLHCYFPTTGRRETLSFPSAFLRGLAIIALAAQPVTLRTEDRS